MPPLGVAAPRQSSAQLPFRLALTYEDAAAQLASRLAGQRFGWAGKSVLVEDARLVAGAEVLTVEAVVSGDLVGNVRLTGRPAFDPETRELYLAGLDYELETADPRVQALDGGLHDLVRGVIAARAHWPLADRVAAFLERAERAVDRALPAGLRVEASLGEIAVTELRLDTTAITVEGFIQGAARVLPR